MMQLTVNVPEVVVRCKELFAAPGKLIRYLKESLVRDLSRIMEQMMESEVSVLLGRKRYQRRARCAENRRNGHRVRRYAVRGLGELTIRIPRDRLGRYQSSVLPRYKRYEEGMGEEASVLFLLGMSTRNISMISQYLFGRRLSASVISQNNTALNAAIEQWRTRDLSRDDIKYLFVDGVNFEMRIGGKVVSVPVLVVVSVDRSGMRKVIALQTGDKESASCWRELFKDLKQRGLDGSQIELGIMDGLPGLEKVFREEFPNASVQRCQVHVARNTLAKVPHGLKRDVADEIRSIFYASSREKAIEFFNEFKGRWEQEIPSAVRCLENNLESCLTYLKFPEEEWISLRTTNCIERLNKEFKRRTKPMEIVAGESCAYRLLGIICLKMELTWRVSRFGRDHSQLNIPILERAHFY
jgi:putative transposase